MGLLTFLLLRVKQHDSFQDQFCFQQLQEQHYLLTFFLILLPNSEPLKMNLYL